MPWLAARKAHPCWRATQRWRHPAGDSANSAVAGCMAGSPTLLAQRALARQLAFALAFALALALADD
eukprot:12819261-Heterocapsa_arctica.AAC.1